MLAVFMIPIAIVTAAVFALPAVYDGTFVGELGEKYDRLKNTDEPKIVIVSGSSSAFGYDSALIEEKLGKKAVNFGLYANLGTKLMMDLSRANINEGDIIILAPEMNYQTLSLYFNPETTAQALDGSFYILKDINKSEYEPLIGSMWSLAGNKLYYMLAGEKPSNAGAYKKENFNEYGDNTYKRPYNIMTGFGNPITLDFNADYSDNTLTEYEEYINYVNDYVKFAEGRGAEVYFSFSPMNRAAVEQGSGEEMINEFYKNLCLSLDCKVISNIYDCIMDEGYFYDSEFHLNDSGVIVNTVRLIDDIKREQGDTSVTLPVNELPAPAGHRPDCRELELTKTADRRGWIVTGLSEQGKSEENIVIPDSVNGLKVTEISSGAFNSGVLKTVTVGKNIAVMAKNSFESCHELLGIIFPEGANAQKITADGFIGSGCSEDLRIFVSSSDYDGFVNSKSFKNYRSIIKNDEKFKYSMIKNDKGTFARIAGLTESGKLSDKLLIPDEYNGVPVASVGEGAFSGAENLTEITLGRNIRSIAKGSLRGVPNFIRVYIPQTADLKRLNVPENPADLGAENGAQIIVGWESYQELLDGEEFKNYSGVLVSDNPYLILKKSGGRLVDGYGNKRRG